jgi:hypothetical protein
MRSLSPLRTTLSHLVLGLVLIPAVEVSAIDPYPVTPKAFGSNRFELEVDGTPVFVHKFKDIHYAHFPRPETPNAQITVQARRPFQTVEISPKTSQIPLHTDLEAATTKFALPAAGKLVLTLDSKERLFLFPEDASLDTVPESAADSQLNVLTFGADPSGETLSTLAIQKAIDSAPAGSVVTLPPGHYVSGSVHLKSGITLLLQTGALLQAAPDPRNFEPQQSAFIVLDHCDGVTIKGGGTIDGSGAFLRNLTAEEGRLLAIRDSRNVRIEGVILRDPRAWNTHVIRSEHVTFQNVKILNDRFISNTDGINPDSSSHVQIEDSFFYCGDDAVAIKSSNLDGRFKDVSDITVRHNIMLTHKSALKMGTETHASEMRNITFAYNEVIECDRGMSIYARDGTHVHSVKFIGNNFESPYHDYEQKLLVFEVKKRNGLSQISDILIQDTTVNTPWPKPSTMRGLLEGYGVSNVRFVNYRYNGVVCASPEDADLTLGPFVEGVTFAPAP